MQVWESFKKGEEHSPCGCSALTWLPSLHPQSPRPAGPPATSSWTCPSSHRSFRSTSPPHRSWGDGAPTAYRYGYCCCSLDSSTGPLLGSSLTVSSWMCWDQSLFSLSFTCQELGFVSCLLPARALLHAEPLSINRHTHTTTAFKALPR